MWCCENSFVLQEIYILIQDLKGIKFNKVTLCRLKSDNKEWIIPFSFWKTGFSFANLSNETFLYSSSSLKITSGWPERGLFSVSVFTTVIPQIAYSETVDPLMFLQESLVLFFLSLWRPRENWNRNILCALKVLPKGSLKICQSTLWTRNATILVDTL